MERSELHAMVNKKLLDMRSLDNKMKEIIRELDIEKSRLKTQMDVLRTTNKSLEKENIDLIQKLDKLNKHVKDISDRSNCKDVEIEAHKDAIKIQKTQITSLQRGKTQAEKELKETSLELGSKKEDNFLLNTQVTCLKNTVAGLRTKLKERNQPSEVPSKSWLHHKVCENNMLYTRIKKHQQIIENLNQKIKHLKEENDRLQWQSGIKVECIETQANKIFFKILKQGINECTAEELERIYNLVAFARNQHDIGEDRTVLNLPCAETKTMNFYDNLPFDPMKHSNIVQKVAHFYELSQPSPVSNDYNQPEPCWSPPEHPRLKSNEKPGRASNRFDSFVAGNGRMYRSVVCEDSPSYGNMNDWRNSNCVPVIHSNALGDDGDLVCSNAAVEEPTFVNERMRICETLRPPAFNPIEELPRNKSSVRGYLRPSKRKRRSTSPRRKRKTFEQLSQNDCTSRRQGPCRKNKWKK